MDEFSFGFREDCLLQLNDEKQLRSVAKYLISRKELNEFIENSERMNIIKL